jgi:hypothetical protein
MAGSSSYSHNSAFSADPRDEMAQTQLGTDGVSKCMCTPMTQQPVCMLGAHGGEQRAVIVVNQYRGRIVGGRWHAHAAGAHACCASAALRTKMTHQPRFVCARAHSAASRRMCSRVRALSRHPALWFTRAKLKNS